MRAELMRSILRAARFHGVRVETLRRGSPEVLSLDGHRLSIPHHRELSSDTIHVTRMHLIEKVAQDWWR
jgi:hypothetical protein